MFHFFAPPADFSSVRPAPRIARVRAHIRDTRTLLASLGKSLNFPPYYGKNFDALWDCVRDLNIVEHRIVILHNDLPAIGENDLEIYVGILRDAALYWKKHPREHSLESWFPIAVQIRVESVLGEIAPPDSDAID